jgi:hypothetical protein
MGPASSEVIGEADVERQEETKCQSKEMGLKAGLRKKVKKYNIFRGG